MNLKEKNNIFSYRNSIKLKNFNFNNFLNIHKRFINEKIINYIYD